MKNCDIVLTLIGVYLVATSVFAFVGRLTGIECLYDWGDGVGMAYTTALNFGVTGVALVVLGKKCRPAKL